MTKSLWFVMNNNHVGITGVQAQSGMWQAVLRINWFLTMQLSFSHRVPG